MTAGTTEIDKEHFGFPIEKQQTAMYAGSIQWGKSELILDDYISDARKYFMEKPCDSE